MQGLSHPGEDPSTECVSVKWDIEWLDGDAGLGDKVGIQEILISS